MSYAPYPAYKDSGVPWLGQVPEGWDVKRLRYASKLADERLPYDELQRPYVGLENIESWTGKRIPDEEARAEGIVALFETGDVLFGKLRPYLAKVHRAEAAGCSSTEALILRGNSELDTHFLKYFMLSPAFIDEVNATTYGAKMPRANWSDVGGLPVSLPPLEEQTAIARFLDQKTAEIDDLIAKKEELLHLLAEQRTALITHAVTKGLDPSAPTKSSGIRDFGEIPEHWEFLSLRWIVRTSSGDFLSNDDLEAISDEEHSFSVVGGNGHMGFTHRINYQADAIVVGRVGAHCGNVHYLLAPTWVTDNALKIKKTRSDCDTEFLAFLLRTLKLNDMANKNAQPLITGEMIKSRKIVLPPKREQIEILKYVKSVEAKLDGIISKVRVSVELLKEHRTALITNAVTGKIKVA